MRRRGVKKMASSSREKHMRSVSQEGPRRYGPCSNRSLQQGCICFSSQCVDGKLTIPRNSTAYSLKGIIRVTNCVSPACELTSVPSRNYARRELRRSKTSGDLSIDTLGGTRSGGQE